MKIDIQNLLPDELLPPHLAERTRSWDSKNEHAVIPSKEGTHVLYWMASAVRGDENPALDVAFTLAEKLSLPIVVCQELSEDHPYASDRHFVFEMEGARDVQIFFNSKNIPYIFNLKRLTDEGQSKLEQLAKSAAIIVIEDMPVPSEVQRKSQVLDEIGSPVLAVDTACVLPMELVGKAYTRAFSFRHATSKERSKRVKAEWALLELTDLAALNVAFRKKHPELFLNIVDLQNTDLARLALNLEIDHSIPPAGDTEGGGVAGYKRWDEFKARRLNRYASDRNDPLLEPSSRLSAYLRLGHISPFRIAREAATSGASGAYKFLDELLIWRELSYSFCRYYDGDLDTLEAIPEWARNTLLEHAVDEREHTYSWATLARGKTANALWNASQQSLIVNGELHNNLRMTWGKAFVPWTRDASDALQKMIDLNHRFALDGNDPSSYGGLLWCLGQFDRPFTPEKPAYGTVRPRSLAHHAGRLNVEKFTTAIKVKRDKKVGIIGCGMAGLICAQTLQDQGFSVELFDKGRSAGGRIATRTTNRDVDPLSFDHGAQYFTAKSKLFRRQVLSWVEDGAAAVWVGKIATLQNGSYEPETREHERFVGTPGMRSIAEYLAKDLDVKILSKVSGLRQSANSDKWLIEFEEQQEQKEFDALVIALPPAQAADLVAADTELQEICKSVKMAPCWAALLAFDSRLDIPFDGLFVRDAAFSWIARDSSKPGRAEGERWVLHASPEWSQAHLEDDAEIIQKQLTEEFFAITKLKHLTPAFAKCHRWRYALPVDAKQSKVLLSSKETLAVCGDWCHGARIEGAFLSGVEAAARLINSNKMDAFR